MPGCSNKKFSNLRSLCAMPCWCRYLTADNMSHINLAAWALRRRKNSGEKKKKEMSEGVVRSGILKGNRRKWKC